MSKHTELELGSEIGPYRVEALLGRGGMACVYRVWHTGLHRHEALKLLAPHMTYDRVFIERFLMEARTAAGLSFPNIGMLYSVSLPDADIPYFTMELIEGGDLAGMLDERGKLTLDEALPLLVQIAAGLNFAHSRGVIHRDVKPANILLDGDPPNPIIKIVDFGIARALESDATRLTKAGSIVGTPEYMSPEQAGSGAEVSERSDQYSLGVIAYEMLCGQTPFPSKTFESALAMLMCQVREPPPNPLTFAPDLPPYVVDALMKALAKDPADRFESCLAFVGALQQPAKGKAGASKGAAKTPSVAKFVPANNTVASSSQSGKKAPSNTVLIALSVAVVIAGIIVAVVIGNKKPVATAPDVAPKTTATTATAPVAPQPSGPSEAQIKAKAEVALAKTAVDYVAIRVKDYLATMDTNPLTTEQADALKAKLSEEDNSALAHCKAAIALDPMNVDAYVLRARALAQLGKKSEAAEARAKAEQLFPGNPALKALH